MGLAHILGRLTHTSRIPPESSDLTAEQIDAWVEASGREYFEQLDRSLVERAQQLGVDRGMVLDLGSPLGLLPLKILWEHEDLMCMAVYSSVSMAERARQTAEEWDLADRMFFQVGEPHQMRFKTGYFDMVVSDGSLHNSSNPFETLRELSRVTKPSGAILIRDLRRPSRLGMSRHIARYQPCYDPRLQEWFETGVRAGFTAHELADFARRSGVERVQIVGDPAHVILERRGANDPASWIAEREKYL